MAIRLRTGSRTERTLAQLQEALERAGAGERVPHPDAMLQSLDPRVKVISFVAFVSIAAFAQSIAAASFILTVALALAQLSRVRVIGLIKRVWLPVSLLAVVIGAPAIVSVPGEPFAHILGVSLSRSGLRVFTLLLVRSLAAGALAALLVATTPWSHVLKSLRILRVPLVFIVLLAMTYRFVILLASVAVDMLEAWQSRTAGRLHPTHKRRVLAGMAGMLVARTLHTSEDVYLAMQSRGYRGEVHVLQTFAMSTRDWIALAAGILTAAGAWSVRV